MIPFQISPRCPPVITPNNPSPRFRVPMLQAGITPPMHTPLSQHRPPLYEALPPHTSTCWQICISLAIWFSSSLLRLTRLVRFVSRVCCRHRNGKEGREKKKERERKHQQSWRTGSTDYEHLRTLLMTKHTHINGFGHWQLPPGPFAATTECWNAASCRRGRHNNLLLSQS